MAPKKPVDGRSKLVQIACPPDFMHGPDGETQKVLLVGLGSDGRLWVLLPGKANWSEIRTPYNKPAEKK